MLRTPKPGPDGCIALPLRPVMPRPDALPDAVPATPDSGTRGSTGSVGASNGMRRRAPRRGAITAPGLALRNTPRPVRWGTVSLVRGPAETLLRFAAHHLDLGASAVHLYLDAPDPAVIAALSGHSRLHVTACDADWWAAQPKPRMAAHQMRQVWVASQCYRRQSATGTLDWLAHIDVDEFLLPLRPVADVLGDVATDQAGLLLRPVELLAPADPARPGPLAQFKTTARMAGQGKSVLTRLYPTFGPYLRGGYISHLEGKMFARTGIARLRLGVHGLLLDGAAVANRALTRDLLLGHAHAPDWATFRAHLQFRMTDGSYRKTDEAGFRLRDVLAYLLETEGETGLRAFYDEVCTARPDLVAALQALGMLVSYPLDLAGAMQRHFGGPERLGA